MQYFSLLASLPMLKLFEAPAITTEKFFEDCTGWVFGTERIYLHRVTIFPDVFSAMAPKPLLPKGSAAISGHPTRTVSGSFDLAEHAYRGDNPAMAFPARSLAQRYTVWEMALRNSIARLRAGRLGGDFGLSVRYSAGYQVTAGDAVQRAYATKNPLEREKILDQARWTEIEELEQKNLHRFCFDSVCGYRLKLQLCEKWQTVKAGDAVSALERSVTGISAQTNLNELTMK